MIIEVFFNPHRRHSSLGNLPPAEFEREPKQRRPQAALEGSKRSARAGFGGRDVRTAQVAKEPWLATGRQLRLAPLFHLRAAGDNVIHQSVVVHQVIAPRR